MQLGLTHSLDQGGSGEMHIGKKLQLDEDVLVISIIKKTDLISTTKLVLEVVSV